MFRKKYIFVALKGLTVLLVLLCVFYVVLIFLATKRRAEEPRDSKDSKSNNSLISEYKLIDSVFYIEKERFKINEVWSSFHIASYRNIFVRNQIRIGPPHFLISIENGFKFILKYKRFKFYFPQLDKDLSMIEWFGDGEFFLTSHEFDNADLKKLMTQDTINFYLLNPQDSIINKFTMIKTVTR